MLFLFQLTRYISLVSVSTPFTFVGLFEYAVLGLVSNLLFLIIPYFFLKITIKKYAALLAVPLVISNVFYFTHLFFLKTPISLGAIAVIGETSPQETIEFLSLVGPKIILGSIFLALLPLSVLFIKVKSSEFDGVKQKLAILILLPLYLIVNLSINKRVSQKTLIPFYNSFVFNDITQIRYYYKEQKKLTAQMKLRKDKKLDATFVGKKDEQNIILIIGESMSKYHVPFYGYKRNTMPQLSKIKDELFIFNNVISPATQTRESILRMLTMAAENDENPFYEKASVIKAANEAGYETSWISNQMMLGISDTETSVIAKDSKFTKFINSDWHTNSLDENLLPYLKDRLNKKSSKKLIVLHMLGNHFEYQYRYPKEDNYFNNLSDKFSNYLSDNHKKVINHYDNSIRYSDNFIYNVIKQVRSKNIPSVVIYLSDHGEELYDDENLFIGHGSPDLRKEAVDIPFFMWYSKHYEKEELPSLAVDNKYNSGDLFFTLADVMNLSFKELDKTKSIVSPHFVTKKRRVVNSNNVLINYTDIH